MLLIATFVTVTVAAMAGTASAGSDFEDDELVFGAVGETVDEEVDRDGDGSYSSVTVNIHADTRIREGTVGKRDIPEDHAFNVHEGEPKFALFGYIDDGGTKRKVLLGIKQVDSRIDVRDEVEMEIGLRDGAADRDVWIRDKEIRALEVLYLESDSRPDAIVLKDVDTAKAVKSGAAGVGKVAGGVALIATGAVPAGVKAIGSSVGDFFAVGKSIDKSWSSDDVVGKEYTTLDEPIVLERPSNDRKERVRVTSNVDGASVSVDGDRVGSTPWTETYAVDHADNEGRTTIRVDADGYEPASRSIALEPPETVNFRLDKKERPLVVNATPSNASIYIDGQYVGEPPVKREFWVEDSVDVWINHSDYVNEDFTDVSAPRTIDTALLSYDDVSSTGGTYEPVGGFSTYDSYSFDDDLLFELDLSGLFWANFSYVPRDPFVGDAVSFDGTFSTSLSGNITRYQWKLGDGDVATGPHVSHVYDAPGDYPVELTVTNDAGNTSSTTETVTVPNAPPDAAFFASSRTAAKGQSLTFDASSTTDLEDAVVSYSWDLDGDGAPDATGETVSHAYASAGTYTVTLTVTDDAGNEDTVSKTVTVERPNAQPKAAISDAPSEGEAGEQMTFDASASTDPDGSITRYNWEFGDGEQSSGATVSHSYQQPGTYQVTLLVADDRSDLATTTTTVEISNASTAGDDAAASVNASAETNASVNASAATANASMDDQTNASIEDGGRPEDGNASGAGAMPGFGAVVAALALGGASVLGRRSRR